MYHATRQCILCIVRDRCMFQNYLSALCFWYRVRSVRSVRGDQPHHEKTGILPQIHCCDSYSTLGERQHMYLPWKWSYHSATWNIKQYLVCYLWKSRTNNIKVQKTSGLFRKMLEKHKIKSIFRVELHFPNTQCCTLLSTHSFSLQLQKHYHFVNGLPPCSHPRIMYSMKTWGILLWLLVSCFLWKIQPPHSDTNTLMSSTVTH